MPTSADLTLAREFHETLRSANNLSTFLRVLVFNTFQAYGAVAAYINVLADDSTVRILESFGYEGERFTAGVIRSIWEHSASNDALRSGEIAVFESKAVYLSKYPMNADLKIPGSGFVSIPLWFQGSPAAVVSVAFDREFDKASKTKLANYSKWIQLLLEVSAQPPHWLTGNGFEWNVALGNANGNGASVREPLELPENPELTKRQLDVLQGMSEHLTNRQIAARLHVSESTVGKESMEIFRKLHVGHRQHAVNVGLEVGILHPAEKEIEVEG
jgi:DNA-binding CsgD family transcriptional regulator